jgi:uncharacterized protein (DUF58 family)
MLATRAFDPDFLQHLDGLVLGTRRARTVRTGLRNVGRVLGTGLEQENFRQYSTGDDLRFLDWNTYARLDDLTIRTYRAERQIELTVIVDASASMGFPQQDDKLGLALLLGGALAYIGMSENDSVRMGAIGGGRGAERLRLTPFYRRRETFFALRPFVTELKAEGQTQMAAAISEFLLSRHRAGIVILLSDFLVNPVEYEDALNQLVSARHEVKVVHVMGDRESAGDYPPGAYRVRDSETGEIREVTFGALESEACRRRVEHQAERLSAYCQSHGIVYSRAFGAANLEATIRHEFPRLGVIV